MTIFFWMVEFILEACGAYLYVRRSKLLSALLGMCALGDLITFLFYGSPIYANAFWVFYSVKYLMLIWLACSICGMFVAEKCRSFATLSAAFLSLGSASIIAAFSLTGETLKDKLLDGEIAANMLLLGFVLVGWISRRDKLNQALKWIVAGFIVMVGSDLLFTILWTFWAGARHWYPLGAIAAQLVWVCGPLRTIRLEKKVQEQIEFGRFLIAEDRNPVNQEWVM